MKINKITLKKNKAQAMVEFAIVLPILLMLLYGILEAGRLLFIYSTIVTASRQAVRYGSATGEGSTTGFPRYQDCTGIRQAAQRVDYLNAFDDEDIHIYHDDGPDPSASSDPNDPPPGLNVTEYCFNPAPTDTWTPTTNTSRLVVRIDGDYLPIVPRIVGFLERSADNGNAIRGQSARTVLVSVSIQVTAPPPQYTPSTSTFTPSPVATATNTPTDTPTNTPSPTLVVSNTPSFTPSPTLTLTATLSPTVTSTRTPSFTPSPTRTRVLSCNSAHGSITLPGNNTMTMTISNPNAWPMTMQDVFVVWDHDRGHLQGNDKSLILQSASLGGTPFWTGTNTGPSTTLSPTSTLNIPAGSTVTIVFSFHQAYDRSDGSEEILINLSNPGCENFPIHVKR
ncbi:MAG TPA: TadE family protein [Anaerolineales bacterium]|nr:TadE family protein [Anaerolineales bacterium]